MEIIASTLAAARSGRISRTKLMYKSFLSVFQAKEFLTILIERGLISYDEQTRTLITTEKGIRTLQAYNELCELTKTVDENKVTRPIVSEIKI